MPMAGQAPLSMLVHPKHFIAYSYYSDVISQVLPSSKGLKSNKSINLIDNYKQVFKSEIQLTLEQYRVQGHQTPHNRKSVSSFWWPQNLAANGLLLSRSLTDNKNSWSTHILYALFITCCILTIKLQKRKCYWENRKDWVWCINNKFWNTEKNKKENLQS